MSNNRSPIKMITVILSFILAIFSIIISEHIRILYSCSNAFIAYLLIPFALIICIMLIIFSEN